MRRRSLGKIDIPDKKRKYSIHSETYQYNLKGEFFLKKYKISPKSLKIKSKHIFQEKKA